jgi:phosphatidylinositol glycan class Q protein
MLMSDGLLRVFWPYDLPRSSSPGVIVGWRNSELDLFVLTVLEDVEVGPNISESPAQKKLTTP